jgi:hypothetical protein
MPGFAGEKGFAPLREQILLGFVCRTTASALIWPSSTRKYTSADVVSGIFFGVLMKTPPKLTSRTGETSSRPLHPQ